MKPVILLTAFEPFGGDQLNPTALILDRLPDEIGGFSVRKVLLPVEFTRAQELASAEYDACEPAAAIMLGQAGGRSAVTPETVGKNVMDARIPDNAGYQPKGVPVDADGPESLPSTLPVGRIVEALRAEGIPCELSHDAGGYVCNALLYGMLRHDRGAVPTGFIHVPFIPEQGHADKPSLELEQIYQGILTAVETVAEELKPGRSTRRNAGDLKKGVLIRAGVFYGMLGLYGLCFGLETDNGVRPWAMIAWLVLLAGLIVVLFVLRKKTAAKRENVSRPKAASRREMRLKALLYSGFAAFAALWMLLLRLVEASSVAWELGLWILVPALLLVAAGLLIASFVTRKEANASASEDMPEQAVPAPEAVPTLRAKSVPKGVPKLLIAALILLAILLNLAFFAALSFALSLGELKGLALALGFLAFPLDAAGIIYLIFWLRGKKSA